MPNDPNAANVRGGITPDGDQSELQYVSRRQRAARTGTAQSNADSAPKPDAASTGVNAAKVIPELKPQGDQPKVAQPVQRRETQLSDGISELEAIRRQMASFSGASGAAKPKRPLPPNQTTVESTRLAKAAVNRSDTPPNAADKRIEKPTNAEPPVRKPQSKPHKPKQRRQKRQLSPRERARRRRTVRFAVREALIWIASMAAIVVIALLIHDRVFEIAIVRDSSMESTLKSGEVVFINKLVNNGAPLKYGDVVLCEYPNRDGAFLKRVIGTAGDTVLVENSRTYLNGVALSEDFNRTASNRDYGPVEVPEGTILVMGDNRGVSYDSRYDDVGAISAQAVIGTATRVVWPLSAMRRIR